MKKLLALAAVFAALTVPARAADAIAPAQRTITVSGEASDQVAPDQAILSMSLVSKDKVLATAKQANDQLVENVVRVTRQFQIPKEKVATSGIYISPEYNYDNRTGQQNFVGYSVSRSLRITIDNLDIHEKLMSALIDAKVDQINGIEFAIAKPETFNAPLRVKAFTDAKTKAQALAEAAGAKLGPALTITTEGVSPPVPRPMMAMAMRADAQSAAPSLPGLIDLRESVTVTFELQ